MARKKIREYHGKRMLMRHFAQFSKLDKKDHADIKCELLDENTNYRTLAKNTPWLNEVKLVAKPDMMFGQRGKHDLVLLNATFPEVEKFVTDRMNKVIEVNGVSAPLTHFLVEPFVPHKEEYYISISVERDYTKILFSPFGGIHVEENWDKMVEVKVPTGDSIDEVHKKDFFRKLLRFSASISLLFLFFSSNDSLFFVLRDIFQTDLSAFEDNLSEAAKPHANTITEFVRSLFRIFEYLDFTLLEINPFVLSDSNQPVPLDLVAEVDDTALFKNEVHN